MSVRAARRDRLSAAMAGNGVTFRFSVHDVRSRTWRRSQQRRTGGEPAAPFLTRRYTAYRCRAMVPRDRQKEKATRLARTERVKQPPPPPIQSHHPPGHTRPQAACGARASVGAERVITPEEMGGGGQGARAPSHELSFRIRFSICKGARVGGVVCVCWLPSSRSSCILPIIDARLPRGACGR